MSTSDTVSCAECGKEIPKAEAVAGVSHRGWICQTCFAVRVGADEAVQRGIRRKGVVLLVIGSCVFLLGLVLMTGVLFILPSVGAGDPYSGGSMQTREIQGGIEAFIFATAVVVAGLSLALTGVFRMRRKSRYAQITAGPP